MDGLSIIVPVYNEETNITFFLNTLESNLNIEHEVLIVYDFDEDNTIKPVKNIISKYSNIRLIKNIDSGAKNAFLTGVENSKFNNLLIAFPDEIFLIKKIEEMFKLINNGYDIVSGTRYKNGGKRLGGSMIGKILSKSINFVFHNFFKFQLSDTTTGFKMFKKNILNDLKIETKAKNWSFIMELTIKAYKNNLKITEVPIHSCDRVFGDNSKGNLIKSLITYLTELRNFLK